MWRASSGTVFEDGTCLASSKKCNLPGLELGAVFSCETSSALPPRRRLPKELREGLAAETSSMHPVSRFLHSMTSVSAVSKALTGACSNGSAASPSTPEDRLPVLLLDEDSNEKRTDDAIDDKELREERRLPLQAEINEFS